MCFSVHPSPTTCLGSSIFACKGANLGLAKQCVTAWKERKVLALTNTFLTLSLDEIGGKVDVLNQNALESLLIKMVRRLLLGSNFHLSLSAYGTYIFFSKLQRFLPNITCNRVPRLLSFS